MATEIQLVLGKAATSPKSSPAKVAEASALTKFSNPRKGFNWFATISTAAPEM